MKISLNWVGDFVDISDVSAEEISRLLSAHTAEVEDIEYCGENISGVVVAEVLTCEQHPDADKLSVTTLNFGADEPVQVVCGAANVRAGLKVALAPVGCVLPGDFKIKKAKLRGQLSQGMICSDSEIELGDASDGIKELPSDAPVGTRLIDYLCLSGAVLELDKRDSDQRFSRQNAIQQRFWVTNFFFQLHCPWPGSLLRNVISHRVPPIGFPTNRVPPMGSHP